jgi:hypothetical protein
MKDPKMTTDVVDDDCSIIALDRFIQATRDSGYKGTASAVSELIDNSLQAGATKIDVEIIEVDGEFPVSVSIFDNGSGMDPFTLRQALRFGGSSRFGDRSGLGRYGMGLPNASLSQARRVVVHTWQSSSKVRANDPAQQVYSSYLDVDEIAAGELSEVPTPKVSKFPPDQCRGKSGTLVVWERCDRLDNRRVGTVERKLAVELGRRFRHFIWKDVRITINGERVEAVDPLFLHGKTAGAELFGEELHYEVAIDPTNSKKGTSIVRVRFAELPVHEWGSLSNEEKASRGISKGAGVSIVRAGREVDYGWFFMGEKRRENYDDWWRCEILFDPVLDEAFGITHTKQQVRPSGTLQEILVPDIEELGRTLNSRVRKAHLSLKTAIAFQEAAAVAGKVEPSLKPLPAKTNGRSAATMTELRKRVPELRKQTDEDAPYKIVEATLRESAFFGIGRNGGQIVLALNPEHPFYKQIYRPVAEGGTPRDKELKVALELLLLSAARVEAGLTKGGDAVASFRAEWSDALAAFLNAR